MKRVLYLVGTYPCLSESFIAREITTLRSLGLEIVVAPIFSESRDPVAGHAHSRHASWRPVVAELRARHLAKRIARQYPGVDHLHAHFLGVPALSAWYLARFLGCPYSLSAHARDIYVEKTPVRVVEAARFRVTCTAANANALALRYPAAPFHTVYHGVPFPAPPVCAAPPGPPWKVLAVGRLVEKKGFPYLLQACHVLRQRGLYVECWIAGEGPLRAALESQILALDLGQQVRLLGNVPGPEVWRLYHQAHVLVAPSVQARDGDRDGIPNVVLEAMAAGTPVVGTAAGSLPEVLCHQRTGLVARERDSAGLADQLLRILQDHPLREMVINNARRQVQQHFDPGRNAAKLLQLFLQEAPMAAP